MSLLVLRSSTGFSGDRAVRTRRKLRPPTLLTNLDGSRSLVWVLPGTALAERFVDLLAEVGITGKAKIVDQSESLATVDYPEEMANHVVFACYLLNQFYTDCQKLNQMWLLEEAENDR